MKDQQYETKGHWKTLTVKDQQYAEANGMFDVAYSATEVRYAHKNGLSKSDIDMKRSFMAKNGNSKEYHEEMKRDLKGKSAPEPENSLETFFD